MYNNVPIYKTAFLKMNPRGSKHVDDITNKNISVEKMHFVGLYFNF